jgi:hypothetical protein
MAHKTDRESISVQHFFAFIFLVQQRRPVRRLEERDDDLRSGAARLKNFVFALRICARYLTLDNAHGKITYMN